MTPNVFIPTPDPYVGLFRMLGGKPQVLCHADDLPSGTVATWDARHGALAGTTAGSPSRADAGWSGGGGLTMPSLSLASNGQWVAYDSEASNYAATTDLLWIIGVKFTALATARNLVALGATAVSNQFRGVHIQAADNTVFWSNRSGTTETDIGSALTESVQALYAIHLKGGTITVLQKTSSGDTTLVNTTHAQSGTLTCNKFTLGALILSGAQSNGTATGDYRFFCAMRAPATEAADLSNVLNYVRHNLRCPL